MPRKENPRARRSEEHQSSESGEDHDHDHDQDHDHDNDNDHDHDHDHDEHDHAHENNPADGAALVKRKRLTQACDPCRKKKIKCDGVKPSCANCTKLNGNCTYLPSMKKRGPRQGYIELLEKRLDKMEQLLQHGPAAIDPELLDSKSILSSRLRPGTRRSPSPVTNGASQSESRVRVDPDERYFGTTSGYTSQYAEYDKQNDPAKDVVGPKYSSQSTLPSKDRPKIPLYGIKDEIPRKDILDHLVDLFFDSIYFQLPIIHPGTFMKQYKEGKVQPNLLNAMCASVARFSNHPDVVTTPTFLAGEPFATNVRGMLVDSIDVPTVSNVQALLFLSMYEYGAARGPRAWMFGGMAVRQAQELGLNREDSSPVFHLKGDWVMCETRRRTFWACFMLDVLASSSSGRPRMIDERDCEVLLPSEDHDWCDERPVVTEMLDDGEDSSSGTEHEVPTTSRTAEEKSSEGLVQDTSPPATAHTADVPASHAAGTQTSAERKDAAASSSPSKTKKQGAGHVLSSFAYLIRIVAVLGKVSQYVNRPRSKKAIPPNQRGSEFSVIDAALAAWHKSIPPQLAHSLENGKMVKDKGEGCIIVFMHVIYHTAVVLLHRPILAADKAAFPLDSIFVENSVTRCTDAANKVSDVLEFVQAYNCPPRIFISAFFAYPVFTTATIHITNAFASDSTVAAKARRSLSIHVKILQTMKSYWSMADKFFYIIRDLYSIQSKISSSGSKAGAFHAGYHTAPGQPTKTSAGGVNGSDEVASTLPGASSETDGPESGDTSGTNSKLASISSFLKSDSGLIALWRRATEMQVLDEAKQEQRRLSLSEEAIREPISLEDKKELHPQDKALQEHRERMNALEIQQINREFDRRWKSKPDEPPSYEHMKQPKQEAGASLEKRHKEEESINPKGSKLAKTGKGQKASKSTARKTRGWSSSDTRDNDNGSDDVGGLPSSVAALAGSGAAEPSGMGQATYRHSILQQPQQLQQQDSYILQPMQIQPTVEPGTGPRSSGVQAGEVNRHLMNVYTQQHRQQEALSQSLDMLQSANIQRQQQQLQMQQEQAAQMSSLAFGAPGGFAPSFLSPSTLQNQQGFSSQGFSSGSAFGLPLVYGSNYDDSQAQRMQTESLGSLFDFALPQDDISFLSNSFQVTPTMMQENLSFANSRVPGSGSMSDDLNMAAVAGSSPVISGSGSVSSSTPLSRPLDSQSPSSDPSNLFNISPRLHSFLMSDEPYSSGARGIQDVGSNGTGTGSGGGSGGGGGMQATPTNLIRYLQLHHQQEMHQQELQQQQNMQPVLNQQNSLIFDDYFPWNQFSTVQQPQPSPQQRQQQYP